MSPTIPELKIDPDFQNLTQNIDNDALEALKKELLKYGCFEPIYVWDNYILDGHKRYVICQKYEIDFKIQKVKLKSKQDAVAWICTRRLKNSDISEELRRYLIGKKYIAIKTVGIMNITGANQYTAKSAKSRPHIGKTAVQIGVEHHLSHSTVGKYFQYAKALDKLKTEFPDIASQLLSGKIKISQDNLFIFAKKTRSEMLRILGHAYQHKSDKKAEVHITEDDFNILPAVSVKDMPVYDPDVYVASLALTIPSWISNIKRTISNSNIDTISITAKQDLKEALDNLISISAVVKNLLED